MPGSSADAAIAADRRRQTELAETAAAVAESVETAGDSEVSATPIATLRYLEARLKGHPGKPLLAAPPLEAMLREQRYPSGADRRA